MPSHVRRMLKRRGTNTVEFELLAAVASLVCVCPESLRCAEVHHFIDSKPARSCILKGASSKLDLSDIAGRSWFEYCHLMATYRAHYVESKLDLADGPSRRDLSLIHLLGYREVAFRLPSFSHGLDSWSNQPD